ncbi:hypothetical protein HYALB_00007432 [Hymenoscyphus albidus]|uniref:Glycoside hydrolase family 71 protein n=1 Tax=Hymenoscyphus albidus TaxID=595503 RepID=A0A9N9M378_9HELO|nr:hypothetical protein HYALB_00007432 [Hymenoscyphus albidus]
MHSFSYLVVAVASVFAIRLVDAKAVFAHYMLGSIDQDHAEKDIEDAIAMGFDAFSINIGFPQAPFVFTSLVRLFDHADTLKSNGGNFRLFISMDLYAAGQQKHADGTPVNAFDYGDTFRDFITRPSYYLGPNGKPFVTTFSDGGMDGPSFNGWRQTLSSTGVYFVPDLDHTQGFNTSHPAWWDYWGPVIDGVTAWESAWPIRGGFGGNYPGDTEWDKKVIEGIDGNPGTLSHGKTYIMPMSTLQYKNAYNTNVYREGGLNLVQRMKETLAMPNGPGFIQVITWNDGPESHYIGNLWPEQNSDAEPALYASSTKGNHKGWQPLIHSFIVAFKQGAKDISQMTLPPGTTSPFTGAIWYKKVLSGANCPGATKPDDYEAAKDKITWAIIVDSSATFVVSSGVVPDVTLSAGMNFGEFDLKAGPPRMTLKGNGVVIATASGGPCAYNTCP